MKLRPTHLRHTHRTHGVRSDYELAAIHAFLVMRGTDVTPQSIEEFEDAFRGNASFERSLRDLADWLEKFHPGIEAEPHQCKGQLCDQDGQFEVYVVRRPQ